MSETVIYPLSEETGLQILAALRRIANALEGKGTSASIEDDMLVASDEVEDGYLVTSGEIEDGYLTL